MMDFAFSEQKSNGNIENVANGSAQIQQFYLGDYTSLGAIPATTKPNRDLLDFYGNHSQKTDLLGLKDPAIKNNHNSQKSYGGESNFTSQKVYTYNYVPGQSQSFSVGNTYQHQSPVPQFQDLSSEKKTGREISYSQSQDVLTPQKQNNDLNNVQNEREMKMFLSQTLNQVTQSEEENQSFINEAYCKKVERPQKENVNPRKIPQAPSSAKNSKKNIQNSNRSSKRPITPSQSSQHKSESYQSFKRENHSKASQ